MVVEVLGRIARDRPQPAARARLPLSRGAAAAGLAAPFERLCRSFNKFSLSAYLRARGAWFRPRRPRRRAGTPARCGCCRQQKHECSCHSSTFSRKITLQHFRTLCSPRYGASCGLRAFLERREAAVSRHPSCVDCVAHARKCHETHAKERLFGGKKTLQSPRRAAGECRASFPDCSSSTSCSSAAAGCCTGSAAGGGNCCGRKGLFAALVHAGNYRVRG